MAPAIQEQKIVILGGEDLAHSVRTVKLKEGSYSRRGGKIGLDGAICAFHLW